MTTDTTAPELADSEIINMPQPIIDSGDRFVLHDPIFDSVSNQEPVYEVTERQPVSTYFPTYVGEYQGGSVFQLDEPRLYYDFSPHHYSNEPDGTLFAGWQVLRLHGDNTTDYQRVIVPNDARIYVDDGIVALDIYENGTTGQVFRLYQSAFNRNPGQGTQEYFSLAYHINEMEVHGFSLVNLANNFLASPEFKTKYGANSSNEEFVSLLYQNTFGRNASDFEINYYTDRLDQGTLDRAETLLSFSQSPENIAQTTPSYPFD